MLDTLKLCEGVQFRLQRQNTHIFFGLRSEGQGLAVVLTIPGFYPGEDMVADYVSGIVSQLGASAFHVREVVLNVILERLKCRREAFVEGLTNLGVAIIDREMAEQMVFEIINSVQPDKVDPNGVMEVFKVYTETEITGISHPGENIRFAGCNLRSPTATGAVVNGHSAVHQRSA